MPQGSIGDKKESEREQSSKSQVDKNIEEIKKREEKKSWLKEKFDIWRHEK